MESKRMGDKDEAIIFRFFVQGEKQKQKCHSFFFTEKKKPAALTTPQLGGRHLDPAFH